MRETVVAGSSYMFSRSEATGTALASDIARTCSNDVVERRGAVAAAEGEGEARARRGQRTEAERLEHARRAGVPWVGEQEGLAGVQCAEGLGPLDLSHAAKRT